MIHSFPWYEWWLRNISFYLAGQELSSLWDFYCVFLVCCESENGIFFKRASSNMRHGCAELHKGREGDGHEESPAYFWEHGPGIWCPSSMSLPFSVFLSSILGCFCFFTTLGPGQPLGADNVKCSPCFNTTLYELASCKVWRRLRYAEISEYSLTIKQIHWTARSFSVLKIDQICFDWRQTKNLGEFFKRP